MTYILKDFVHMANVYGEDVEVFVDVPDGEVEHIVGFMKIDEGLLVKLSKRMEFGD